MSETGNKDPQKSMQMDASTLPDNENTKKAEHQENKENTSKAFAAPPRPSPANSRPQPTPQASKAENDLQKRYTDLRLQIVNTRAAQQVWRHEGPEVKRIQKILANDPVLRKELFQIYGQIYGKSPTVFLTLHPKDQLRLTKDVANHLKTLAQQCVTAQKQQIDPNDVTNPINQANPNNLANQAQAVNAGIVEQEDNEVAQNTLVQNNQQQTEENEHENNIGTTAVATATAFTLTPEDEEEITSNNQQYMSPTPQPGTTSNDEEDEKSHEVGKVVKHEVEIKGVEEIAKSAKAEKDALDAVIGNDKSAFMKAAMGGEKGAMAEAAKVVSMVAKF